MRHSPTGVFIAFRTDRLGGRLNAILTAMRLATAYGSDFRILWWVNEGISPELLSPEDLFSQDFMARHFLPLDEGRKLVDNAIAIGALPRQMDADALRAGLAEGINYLSNSATEQLVLPWESQADLAILPQIIARIGFSPSVQAAMARIDATLAGEDFYSYHLRRGDIIDDSTRASHNLWPNKYIPRVIYEWHIKRMLEAGTGRIIVFSDALAEAKAFAALSDRVSDFDALLGDMVLTPLQRDFLELYTMSRSSQIFAPPASAFSRLAAVIGQNTVTDIEADLSAAEREAALDALVERLDLTPEVFLSQSDAGQNLPFIAQHLESRGQGQRTVAITKKLIAGGMDRAYIYPFLSDQMLAREDYQGCDDLLSLTANRLCQREDHWAGVYLNAALGDMVRDDYSTAINRFHVAAWLSPLHRSVRQAFLYLASSGRLNGQNGLPYDSALMRPAGQIFSTSGPSTHAKLAQKLLEAGLPPLVYPANMEVRDWRRLSGKKLNFRFSNKSRIHQQVEILRDTGLNKRHLTPAREAAVHSAIGHLLTEAGDWQEAARYLSRALEMQPDNPLYIKRLADWAFATGDQDRGLGLLNQAVTLAPDVPAYQGLLALAYQDAKDKAQVETLILRLSKSGTPVIELQLLIIDILRRKAEHLPEALRLLRRLTATAPANFRIATLQAKVLEQSHEWDEALAIIKKMQAMERAPDFIAKKYLGLFKAYRLAHSAQEAVAWFSAHGIELPTDASATHV